MGDFSERLRALRLARGLSLGELARRSGLSRQGLSHLEAGIRTDPSWRTVQALCLALDAPLEALADPALRVPGPQPPGRPGRPRTRLAPDPDPTAPARPVGRPRKPSPDD